MNVDTLLGIDIDSLFPGPQHRVTTKDHEEPFNPWKRMKGKTSREKRRKARKASRASRRSG